MSRTVEADNVLECIVRGDNRREIMCALRGGSMELRELSDSTGIPRTTLRHSIDQLADHGVVAEIHAGKYRLTRLGGAVLEGIAEYEKRVETAIDLEPFLRCVPADELDIDVCGVTDPELTVASSQRPYAPSRRLVDGMADATRVVGFTPVLPAVSQRPFESLVAAEETTLRLVVTTSVANAIEMEFDLRSALNEETTIQVTQRDLSIGGFVIDGTVYLQGFDDNGKPHVVLQTESKAVQRWTTERLDRLREAATTLTAAELGEPNQTP